MHSFHPSRGRILFEVFCTLVIAGSAAGAWMQTGATALLPAAAAALLYGIVHCFDLGRRRPVPAVEPQRIEFAPDGQADLSTVTVVAESEPAIEELAAVLAVDRRLTAFDEAEAAPVEAVATQVDEGVRSKAADKGSRRTAGTKKKSKVSNSKSVDAAEVTEAVEDVPHVHVAPLFEPDPFVRMPRQAFGRRGQI